MTELDVWAVARETLTAKQLEILELRERRGMSLQSIALSKRVSVSTVRGHLRSAEHNLSVALQRRASG